MKTVSQVVDGLNELFTKRNIETLEYDFSREVKGKRIAFFSKLAFVSLDDVRHIANTVAPSEEEYPDASGVLITKLEGGNLIWVPTSKDVLRVVVEHIKDGDLETVFSLSLTIKENTLLIVK